MIIFRGIAVCAPSAFHGGLGGSFGASDLDQQAPQDSDV
jgi:hypothetical protein